MSSMHISAEKGEFAKTVLMPGDPKRSEFVAKNFLYEAQLVNDIRGIQGYTGKYAGTEVSVMASGMGIPSMGIYSYELFAFHGVENIIRIGSAGAVDENIKIGDIVAAQSSSTSSSYQEQFGIKGHLATCADYKLLQIAEKQALLKGITLNIGNCLSSDVFYEEDLLPWRKAGILAVEMETYALYANAARFKKHALGIFTVTDAPLNPSEKAMTEEERRSCLTDMIEIALNVAKTSTLSL